MLLICRSILLRLICGRLVERVRCKEPSCPYQGDYGVLTIFGLERLCCPFLRFLVEVEPNSGPLWMRLTGREGAKEFLRLALEATGLINVDVAQATGFSVTNRVEIDSIETVMAAVNMVNERLQQDASILEL